MVFSRPPFRYLRHRSTQETHSYEKGGSRPVGKPECGICDLPKKDTLVRYFDVPSRFQIGFHIRFICISGHWARCWSKILVLVSVHFFVVEIISGLVSVEFHIGFICGRRHLHNFICGIWLPLLHICSLGSYWFVVLVSDIVSGRAVQVVFQIMFQVRFQIRFQVRFQVFISGTVFAPGPLGRV